MSDFADWAGRVLPKLAKAFHKQRTYMDATIEAGHAFEAAYAKRSGVSVETLREWGRYPAPCDCGEEGCEGWQMAYIEAIPHRPDEPAFCVCNRCYAAKKAAQKAK